MDNQLKLNEAINKTMSGHGLLFTGAGFSLNSKNIGSSQPPLSFELAKKISNLIPDFEEDSDLMFVSDYYIRKDYDKNKLIQLLKNEFIKEISQEHKAIGQLKWKRVYTTNYDNTLELAYHNNDRQLQVISANDEHSEAYNKKQDLCIHINGKISNLNVQKLNTSFKLSDASYLSPESFANSFWYRQFKLDLERAGVIIFIGYSLYDLDIKKILYDNDVYKKKTFFIIREDATEKEVFQLEQYGYVFPIGLKKFANMTSEALRNHVPIEESFFTESFGKYVLKSYDNEVLDSDIREFLQYGNLDSSFKSQAVLGQQRKPYLIIRDKIESVNYLLSQYQYLFVLGDFGNGKTTFLEEIMIKFASENKDVFYLKDFNSNYLLDLEKINDLNKQIYIVIDGYAQCLDIFKFISDNSFENLKFIFSERTTVHNGLIHDISIMSKSVDISIDKLINSEIEYFIKIVDSVGFWGDKSNMSLQDKKRLINSNNAELSLNLLTLFDANNIKDKLKSLVLNIDTKEYKDTFFAICLLEAIGVELNQSLISEVAMNNSIFENNFKNHASISQFFKFSGNELISKSSIFSLYLLNNVFFAQYMIDRLLLLSKRFNEIQHDNYINKEISKYLLRFNFIQRILPGSGTEQNNSLVQYYEKLKTQMPWLQKDIHYWLQYGMCNIALEKYDIAQKHLDNAYAFANARDDYDTFYIDSQQSRLFLIITPPHKYPKDQLA